MTRWETEPEDSSEVRGPSILTQRDKNKTNPVSRWKALPSDLLTMNIRIFTYLSLT